MKMRMRIILFMVVVASAFIWYTVSPRSAVKSSPVQVDFGQMQPVNDPAFNVVFEEGSSNIVINGVNSNHFDCSNGGTVYLKLQYNVYYDCQTKQVAASRIAYPSDIVMLTDEVAKGISGQWQIVGDKDIQTGNGWKISLLTNTEVQVVSPLGDELRLSPKEVLRRDGDAYTIVSEGAPGYLLSVGIQGHTSLIVLVDTPAGWAYVEKQ